MSCDCCPDPVVYRAYDANDVLLYIGVTTDLERRQLEHPWSWTKLAVRWETVAYPCMGQARDAEYHAIRHERPLHNKTKFLPITESELALEATVKALTEQLQEVAAARTAGTT